MKYTIKNDRYFKTINSAEKAYFLGLIFSDGSIIQPVKRQKRIQISLAEEDGYILIKLKNVLGYSGVLYIDQRSKRNSKHKNLISLSIGSNKICNDLIKLGCVPNKSLILRFPEIPKDFISHFIRGLFDGDGCISYYAKNKSYKFQITGTYDICENVKDILSNVINKSNLRKISKNKNSYIIGFNGNKILKKIKNYLYKECGENYLYRKKKIFDMI